MKPMLLDVKSLLKDSIHVKEIRADYLNDEFHFHNAYEIALILKSSGKRIIGDNIEDFNEGDLVLMGPNLPHISYINNRNSPVHALVIYFHPDWLTETQISSPDFVRFRELCDDMKRGIKILGETKRKVTKSILKLKNYKGLQLIIAILEILEAIAQSKEYSFLASSSYSSPYSKKDVDRIEQIYRYVREHFVEEISLQDIATVANMTPTAFCKFFKVKTKKTFSHYVNEVRITHACKLLFNDDLTISQVCFDCGFNNLTNFNKNFKRFTKMVPSEYKACLKEN